jgi:transposase
VSDSIVGIDVSKETLDANCVRGQRKQARIFANSPDGWKLMLSWLKAMGSTKAHICMEPVVIASAWRWRCTTQVTSSA